MHLQAAHNLLELRVEVRALLWVGGEGVVVTRAHQKRMGHEASACERLFLIRDARASFAAYERML